MRFLGLLFLYVQVIHASLMTLTPSILDSYVVHNNLKNPYFSDESTGSIMMELSRDVPVEVFDLKLNRINEIHAINIECFDDGNCDKSISQRELRYLSLYASMIEMCGDVSMQQNYSVGLLRNIHQENTMGKFTKIVDMEGNILHMAFWIRLTTGLNKDTYVYDDLDGYALTVAVLEMAVHERAHYDVTNYDWAAGHCDQYQTWYNTMIQTSMRDLDRYKQLTDFVMGTRRVNVVGTIIFIVVVFCLLSLCLCNYEKEKVKRKKRALNEKKEIV
jgi:hypothetical protein